MGIEQGGADIFGEAKGAEQQTQTQILEDIRTAVQNPPAPPAPEGGATSAKQDTQTGVLQDILAETQADHEDESGLIMWFKMMMQKIAFPAYWRPDLNAIQTTPVSGTITTVTTVTTVTGLTNIDGYQGKTLAINLNTDSWANVVRRTIS